MRIDLHAHTSASDGTDAPEDLPGRARAAGIDVVAITDHDTTRGWERAATAAARAGVTLVRGAELSCAVVEGGGDATAEPITVHLLAYLFDPADPDLAEQRRILRREREIRVERMVELLAADGFPVELARVRQQAGGASIGRPHVARALVAAGVVATVDEAFDRYLHQGGPYYVPKADLDLFTAVRLVRRAGGVTVLAHPLARRRGRVVDAATIAAAAAAGLTGVEVDHTDHSPADRGLLRELAADLGLLGTGSSDYHGHNKTVPLGAELTEPEVYRQLVARASGVEVVAP